MFVYVSFKVDLLDIAHIDGFVNRKRVIILKNLYFIRADSDTWIFVKDCFCLHFELDFLLWKINNRNYTKIAFYNDFC